jgi:hypothetical protein
MSASDTIAVVQTLMAVVTCVLLLIYIVATHRLQRQAQAASRVQQQQIDVAKQQLAEVLLRERFLFRPDLKWRDGSTSESEAKWDFENLGADICNLRWVGPEETALEHEPRHMIRTFDRGSIRISTLNGVLSFPVEFSLTYSNRFGESCNQTFEITSAGAPPKETAST